MLQSGCLSTVTLLILYENIFKNLVKILWSTTTGKLLCKGIEKILLRQWKYFAYPVQLGTFGAHPPFFVRWLFNPRFYKFKPVMYFYNKQSSCSGRRIWNSLYPIVEQVNLYSWHNYLYVHVCIAIFRWLEKNIPCRSYGKSFNEIISCTNSIYTKIEQLWITRLNSNYFPFFCNPVC